MKTVIRKCRLALALLAAAASGPALAYQAPHTAAQGAVTAADLQLRQLYDSYAAWEAKEYEYFEDERGETKPTGRIARVDSSTQLRRGAEMQRFLDRLNAIPQAQLSAEERINAAIFRTILENNLADVRFREWEMPFNSDSSFWTYLDARQPFQSAAEYRRYISRMRDIPRYFDENIANARAGLVRGFSVPRATLEGRDKSIEAFIVQDLAKNPFYKPFEQMPGSIPAAEQQALRAEAASAIREAVLPAYGRLLQFMRGEYMSRARAGVSARELSDGDAYYRANIREYTTTNLSPEEIHQIGLKEVARIDAEMRKTMRESGFSGSFEDYLKFLRTDPRFYAKTPDELMGVSAYAAKRVDARIGDFFGLLPRRRFGIVPVPEALAPFYTAGRGGLENCMMNTHNLPTRPLYNIPALTLHECAPGHSFQAALAEERKELPRFRRNIYFSGYGEGWGLYSEWLGHEMGIYRTPYERFGALSYEMWRAARLVIDTGIHRYGWSRQQAIDYLASHTALSQHEVRTEVDRYISWPGQALSYKLGEITIRELRAEAEAALGPRFDQRAFHDRILALGSVPLALLEEQMRQFIREEAAKPAKPGAAAS